MLTFVLALLELDVAHAAACVAGELLVGLALVLPIVTAAQRAARAR